MFDIFTLPVVAIFDNVALPVTPSVPAAVILVEDVFPTTAKSPLVVVFANVVAPVTFNVLPTVAEPDVVTFDNVVFPVAFNVPYICAS